VVDGSKLPPFVIFKGTILQLQMLSLKKTYTMFFSLQVLQVNM